MAAETTSGAAGSAPASADIGRLGSLNRFAITASITCATIMQGVDTTIAATE